MQHTIKPDAHGPLGATMAHAVQSCVHCGFCLAACPTYKELGQEMDSPRGRIVLMKSVLEGSMTFEEAQPHVDRCLGCLACEPACPSGVPYRDLISPYRALARTKVSRPFADSVRHSILSATLPNPGVFRFAAHLAPVGKALSGLMPKSFQPMLKLAPASLPPAQTWPEVNPAQGTRRARVALLLGCAQQVLDPDINTATIEVLTRNGVEVVIPRAQGCCGGLAWHTGDLPAAQKLASKNLLAFPTDVDAVITNAAGCGSAFHEYHLILKGTSAETAAEAFRHRSMDVSAFLAKLGGLAPVPDSGQKLRVAYHDACHLSNAQGVRSEPRELLKLIPGLELLEIADAHLCCGSAGTYNIEQPALAESLGRQKAGNIRNLKPDCVATGNIGCMTQLRQYLEAGIPVRHTVQILRDAYAGKLGQ